MCRNSRYNYFHLKISLELLIKSGLHSVFPLIIWTSYIYIYIYIYILQYQSAIAVLAYIEHDSVKKFVISSVLHIYIYIYIHIFFIENLNLNLISHTCFVSQLKKSWKPIKTKFVPIYDYLIYMVIYIYIIYILHTLYILYIYMIIWYTYI